MERTGTLAVVAARYGPTVIGGAEAVLRQMALHLADRGWAVEVLTTTATDHYTWHNDLPAGTSDDHGVTVRRFPAVTDGARAERGALHQRLLAGHSLTLEEQQRWINADMRSPELFHHLLDTAQGYRGIISSPYHAWTTFAAGTLVPERSIVIPCLHREPEAAFELFEPLLGGVRGIWCMSQPEADLLAQLQPRHSPMAVVGEGFDPPAGYDAAGFRSRHNITGPFAFYAGRREGAKNWDWLIGEFERWVTLTHSPLQLVTCGAGEVRPPASLADRVIDLGFIEDAERDDAMAAATVYLQPSALESFSRTVCEAWLAGTPVIANGEADPVRWHCERSGGGIPYFGASEFGAALSCVVENPALGVTMGARGRGYVLGNYRWSDVIDRYEASIEEWLPA
ncbi:MAG: glycosyltransferase family 1 protein [Acidimicrobiia bacterium]|nr:glycosyltransferase family 1 protein [Acidimicrobiia bacterium]